MLTPAAEITCIDQSAYGDALTRGKKYPVLDHNVDKSTVRVRSDNARIRWFPASCFDLSGDDCIVLTGFTLDDPIIDPERDCVEVTVHLSDGSARWCFVVTPQWLLQVLTGTLEPRPIVYDTMVLHQLTMLSDPLRLNDGTSGSLIAVPHMLIMNHITHEYIAAALAYLDSQNRIHESTLVR